MFHQEPVFRKGQRRGSGTAAEHRGMGRSPRPRLVPAWPGSTPLHLDLHRSGDVRHQEVKDPADGEHHVLGAGHPHPLAKQVPRVAFVGHLLLRCGLSGQQASVQKRKLLEEAEATATETTPWLPWDTPQCPGHSDVHTAGDRGQAGKGCRGL